MKKNRHWLLTMAMLLSSIMVSAHDFEVDGIYYNILSYTDLTVEVTFRGDEPGYYTDTYTGDVILKSDMTYNGKNYKVVGIGFNAFLVNFELKSITIPESITSIGEASFAMCSSLTSVTIPSGVTSIGLSAFANCSGLKSIVVDANNPIYDSRENCNAVIETATNTLVAGATCTIIPTSVTSIGEQAFNCCEALTSIEIPSSITSIGDLAFQSCGFTNIICKAVTPPAIAASSFSQVNKSIPVYVPASSVSAYQTANYWSGFNNIQPIPSNDLASGVCGDNLTWKLTDEYELIIEGTGDMANFSPYGAPWNSYIDRITSVTISEGVTSIGMYAFGYCSALNTINLPESLTYIGACAFESCTSLTSITLPESITSIGKWGFYGCSSLTSITLPESVTSVGNHTFSDCSSLTTITIPENSKLTSIEMGAFSNCTSLTAINIPEGVTSIESNAFSSCSSLTAIIIPENSKLTSIGGFAFSNCTSLTAINIPEGVTSIESNAFSSCSSLISITIPENVTIIMSEAFNNCSSLTAITIPENSKLTSIGMGAFTGCSNLTAITIPESVKAIEAFTFSNCSSLISFAIPKSASSIGEVAFAGCSNLTSITIPESVTNIGEIAFVECGKLASVISLSSIAPTIASDAFASISSSAVLTIPSGSTSSYEDAGWTSYFSSVVEIKEDILATSLALDVTEGSLAPNETLTLTATLLPEDVTNPALSWTSSNESVATVDANGVVTAVADGEATIIVSTTDGSELSASCTVVVVTEEVVEYDNTIYFEDVTVFTNSSVSHPLQLKNTVDMTAVQFDLYLPEGVSLATDARGRYAITFNADRADNTTHTLSSALQSDGAIRVLCYSTESYDFLGHEGAIFYFPLEIAEMEDGNYDMVIKNIVLTDVSGKKYEIPSMTSTITVLNVAPGDCNADNTIDVADIVVLANHILGNTADGFVEKAADYNADGAVDVADIVNIANYILNGNNAAARALVREMMFARAAAAGYSFDILPFVLDAAGSKSIAIELTDPTESFTAFQCDLYLPEGIGIEKNNRGKYKFSFNEERTDASYHTLSGSQQADGAVRMLCYSTDSEVFLGADGALVYIPLTADASLKEGVYEFSIASTVLTYRNGEKVTPETYKGSIVVGDGGEVKDVKLYGRYTSEVLDEYTAAFGANAGITSLDLTEALYLPADGSLTTGNPNTIVYLAEGDALANENNVVVGDECANLMLADGYAFSAPVAFNASQASYERELAEGKYGTIVLPFAPNTDDYVFYALTSVGDDALIFDEVQSPVANTPYLYKLRDGKSATQITNNEVAVSSELTPTETATWQMVGSFTNQTIAASEDADTYYYVYTSSDNQLHKVTNTLTVKPYRAYFTTNSTNGTQLAIRTRGGEETLIDAAEVEGLSPEVYYDLSGRRVDNPVKGVYIVNGKKVVF